ncbi:MAG: ABC-2 family transporter protein [Candidatus Moraniibacteriota bacterium]
MKDKALKIKKYLKVFIHFKRINFVERVAFRLGFFLMAFGVFLMLFFNLFFIKIIFGWVENINGWNYYEALLVVGTVLLLDGFMWVSCAFVHVLGQHIKMGTLDSLIIKPMDCQFLVSVYRGDLEDAVRIATGLGVMIFALSNLGNFGWGFLLNIFWYLILVFNAFVIIYSISIILTSIKFWTIESGGFHVADTVVRVSQYPTDIFSGKIIHFIFSFIFPLAFIATVPAKILAHGFQWQLVGESFLIAIIFFWLARKVWKLGLSKYSSASS